MKFDLEKAKAGKTVQMLRKGEEWRDVHFVGAKANGVLIFDVENSLFHISPESRVLRMKPETTTRWVNFYDTRHAEYFSSRDEAIEAAFRSFPKPLSTAVKVETEAVDVEAEKPLTAVSTARHVYEMSGGNLTAARNFMVLRKINATFNYTSRDGLTNIEFEDGSVLWANYGKIGVRR